MVGENGAVISSELLECRLHHHETEWNPVLLVSERCLIGEGKEGGKYRPGKDERSGGEDLGVADFVNNDGRE